MHGLSEPRRRLRYRPSRPPPLPPRRAATPYGRHAGDILASNLAPTPGSERHGPTAIIQSYCACDFERLPNGVRLDLKLMAASVRGEAGLEVLAADIQTERRKRTRFLILALPSTEGLPTPASMPAIAAALGLYSRAVARGVDSPGARWGAGQPLRVPGARRGARR